MFSLIVASTPEGGIGYKNKLPWHIPEDLKHFKRTTTGHVVVMGYHTWLSLNETPLPNRVHFILTSKQIQSHPNVYAANNIETLIYQRMTYFTDKKWFIIGGAQVYNQFLTKYSHLIKELYWTIVHLNVNCDCFVQVPTLKLQNTIYTSMECSIYYIL